MGPWQPLVADESNYGQFVEFPVINRALKGQPYRYSWAVCATQPTNVANSIAKFDLEAKTSKVGGCAAGVAGGGWVGG